MTDSLLRASGSSVKEMAKKAKTVPIAATETLDKKKRIIKVCVVDIFGNDAGTITEVIL